MDVNAANSPYPTARMGRRDAWLTAGLLLLTLAARGIAWPLDPVVSRDGATYCTLAGQFNRGECRRFFGMIKHVSGDEEKRDFTDFLGEEQRQHPLFPMLIAFMARVAGDAVLAGKLVSLILGTLTVIPLYLLTRRLFGAEAATGACVLFAFHVYMVRGSVDVLTEPTFLFFFATGLWLIYESVVKRCLALTLFAAISAALAYLVRPEGFGLLFVLLGAIWLWRFEAPGPRWRWRIVATLVALGGFFILAMPYLLVIRHVLGVWWITMKKPPLLIKRLQTTSSLPLVLAASNIGDIAKDIGYGFWKGFHPLILILAAAGAAWRRAIRRNRGELLLAAVFALYFAAVAWLRDDSSYVSRRHFFVLLLVALPFAGAALVEIAAFFSRRLEGEARERRRRTWLMGLAMFCAVVLALKTFPGAVGDDYVIRAGRWIQEHCAPAEPGDLRLMTAADSRVGFYAGAADTQFPLDWIARYEKGHRQQALTVETILTWAKRQHPPVRWLVVQKGELDECAPGLFETLRADPRMKLLHFIDGPKVKQKDVVLVYEMLDP